MLPQNNIACQRDLAKVDYFQNLVGFTALITGIVNMLNILEAI